MYFSDVPTVDWPSGVDTRYDHRGRQPSPEDASESPPSVEQGRVAGSRDERARVRAKVLIKRPASERPPSMAEMLAWASHHEGPVSIGGDESGKRRRALMEWSDEGSDDGEPLQLEQTSPALLAAGTPPRRPPRHHGHQHRPGVRHCGQPRSREELEIARRSPHARPVGEKAGPQRYHHETTAVGAAEVASIRRSVSRHVST